METLPDDCLVNIFSKLTLKDISPILRVRKLWKTIGETDIMRLIAKHMCNGVFANLELDNDLWYSFVHFIVDIQKLVSSKNMSEDNEIFEDNEIKTLDDAFYCIVKNGREEFVKPLISAGANINAKDDFGLFPLNIAVRFDHIGIVKLLLDNGANIEAKNYNGDNALIFSRNGKMTEFLLEHGAKIYPKILINIHHYCPDHLSEVIKCLIKYGLDINEIYHHTYHKYTALFDSCRYNMEEKVKVLLDCGANVNICDSNGDFPINKAVSNGQLKLIEPLYNAGANIDQKDSHGMTPLIYVSNVKASSYVAKEIASTKKKVISEDFIQIAEKLIDMGADINAQDNLGKTALMYACNRGNSRVVKKLLEAGADISIVDKHGNSAYLYARFSYKSEIMEMLPKRQ